MTEQILKKKKKKKIITCPEDIPETGVVSSFANEEYQNPELREEILKLRNKGYSFESIKDEINNKYELDISESTIRTIYEKELAKALTIDKLSNKNFDTYRKAMVARYDRIVKIADFLLEAIEEVRDRFESSDMDKVDKYIAFIKMTPNITRALDQVLSQLEFLRKEDERIKIEQKNIIYSPIQINQYLQDSLGDLIRDGYIKVLRKLPFDEKTEKK